MLAIEHDPAASWLDRASVRLFARAIGAWGAGDHQRYEQTLVDIDRFRCALVRADRWGLVSRRIEQRSGS